MSKQQVKKILLLLVLISLVVMAAAGYLDPIIGFCGMGSIADANATYLDNAFDRSLAGFLILSGIKSGLAIIEGSEVGIGFNLEIGDIVQSVYDYVDVSWKAALAGGTILLITRLCLEAVALFDHWCLSAMVMCLWLFLLFSWTMPDYKRITRMTREAFTFLLVLSLALYVILPISITGASALSKKITQPIIEETHQGFEEINKEFSPDYLSKNLFSGGVNEGSIFTGLDFKAKYESTKERIKFVGKYFKDKAKHIAVLTLKLIAGYLFDCIIFPLTFFLVLYFFTKSLVNFLVRS